MERIKQESDTTINWEKAGNSKKPFIPLKGEYIHYSDINKIKVGDGKTNINELGYIGEQNIRIKDDMIIL